MKPEAQRVAIAEACGWFFGNTGCRHPDGTIFSDYPIHNQIAHAPDYLSDLNAMHEAEKVLTFRQKRAYASELNAVVPDGNILTHDDEREARCEQAFPILCATAAQRAEAFLRTIGKWGDGK